jgi:hypothetical protein
LYQPQVPQTVCGTLADAHRGQTERPGLRSVQADARRLRLFALEVFFLGTAISVFLVSWGLGEATGRHAT